MKIKIKTLKKLIREAIREEDGAVFGTRDELDRSISSMDADTVADKDYIDEETGEVYLEKDQLAGHSVLHPAYRERLASKYVEDQAAFDAEQAEWMAEDERERAAAQQALDAAVKEFAEGAADYTSSKNVDAMDVAVDMADNFFHNYPDWQAWAITLDMSREDIRNLVVDMSYEAMAKGQ